MLTTPQRIAVVALVLCGAILVAIAHRTDPDDAQYLNFVVTAMDFPSEPLFSRSGLWQVHRAPLELPIYALHTYELLIAALSDVFNVDHKVVYYLIMAPIFGGIAVHEKELRLVPLFMAITLGGWFATALLYTVGRIKWEAIRRRFPRTRATGTVALRVVRRNPLTASFLVRFAFGLRIGQ